MIMNSALLLLLLFAHHLVATKKFLAQMPGVSPSYDDQYICISIPLPDFEDSIAYVTQLRAMANESLVHHILLSGSVEELDDDKPKKPGPCSRWEGLTLLFSWAHYGRPLNLPDGSAFPIGNDAEIRSLYLEVHYMHNSTEPDYSGVELSYTLDPQPYSAGIILMSSSSSFSIPPLSQHFALNISCRLRTEVPIHVIGVRTHAHSLGRAIFGFRVPVMGTSFGVIARGNPQWSQTFYRPTQLSAPSDFIELVDNDTLLARCVYDSTRRNRTTVIGSTGDDEMCNLYILYIIKLGHELPESSRLCVDEMVPGAWDDAPPFTFKYAPETPPALSQEESPGFRLEYDFTWHLTGMSLGQVSGVAIAKTGLFEAELFVVHRGRNVWDGNSFDANFIYRRHSGGGYVKSPILQVDLSSGSVLRAFGDDLLLLPHGLSVVHSRHSSAPPIALWVTDVALHQVMKFDWGKWDAPSMVLGQELVPGSDNHSFCQPTDVAVSSNGLIFVADGYCNRRIVKFSPSGEYITSWEAGGKGRVGGGFQVVHSLTIISANLSSSNSFEHVCAADREHASMDCYDLDGNLISTNDEPLLEPSLYAISYSPTLRTIFGVTGSSLADGQSSGFVAAHVISINPTSSRMELRGPLAVNAVVPILGNPHDLDVLPDGSALIIAHLDFPYISRWNIVRRDIYISTSKPETVPASELFKKLMPVYSLMQNKVAKICLILLVCIVVIVIAVFLFRSRKFQFHTASARRGIASKPPAPPTTRSTRFNKDGFRPLIQEDGDYADGSNQLLSDDDDSTTVVDIRNFSSYRAPPRYPPSDVQDEGRRPLLRIDASA